jgi:hypothetical protein
MYLLSFLARGYQSLIMHNDVLTKRGVRMYGRGFKAQTCVFIYVKGLRKTPRPTVGLDCI